MKTLVRGAIVILAMLVLGLLLGTARPVAASSSPNPSTQNVYIQVLAQGVPQTGCSAQRVIPVEMWYAENGQPMRFFWGNTDCNGYIDLVGIPTATGMFYWVKGERWLTGDSAGYSFNMCNINGCTDYVADPDVDLAGDSAGNDPCNAGMGDNWINILDFNSEKNTFGLCTGDPNFNRRDDFNNNGCVNVVDDNYIHNNFGASKAWCSLCGCPLAPVRKE